MTRLLFIFGKTPRGLQFDPGLVFGSLPMKGWDKSWMENRRRKITRKEMDLVSKTGVIHIKICVADTANPVDKLSNFNLDEFSLG